MSVQIHQKRSHGFFFLRRGLALILVYCVCLRFCGPPDAFSIPPARQIPSSHQVAGSKFHARVKAPTTSSRRSLGEQDATEDDLLDTKTQIKLSSVPQSTVNLAKNIVGAGMLSLPAGVAAFSASPKALIGALTITLLLGLVSAYSFTLIADACNRSGQGTYQGAWAKTVSPRSKWLPSIACVANAAIGNIAFSMILGDCLSLVLAPLGVPPALSNRNSAMLLWTVFVLLPLCCMKSLAPLAKFSLLGVLSNFYICGFVALRYFDGSYRAGSALLAAAPALPKFSTFAGGAFSTMLHPGVTVLLGILATAFLAHYNAPLFYEQLAPDADGNKADRFRTVSVIGFGSAALVFCVVMVGGFLTFGSNCSGLILNNYAAVDRLAMLARAAIGLSLTTAYPLVFFSVREQCIELLGHRCATFAAARPNATNILLLGIITAVALRLQNLGKVVGFAGAMFGNFLIYIAPTIMIVSAQRRGIGPPMPKGLRGRVARALQLFLVPLGAALGAVGAYQSLL